MAADGSVGFVFDMFLQIYRAGFDFSSAVTEPRFSSESFALHLFSVLSIFRIKSLFFGYFRERFTFEPKAISASFSAARHVSI
jgi:hypothetical protein